MATPDQGKPSYTITGIWVRTHPQTQELEVLVEHEGAWRVAFGEPSSAHAGGRDAMSLRKLGVTVEDQTIDHAIHVAGLPSMPIEACGIRHNTGARCELEAGHPGDSHLYKGEFAFSITDPDDIAYHELRQAKRGHRPERLLGSTPVDRVRRHLRRRR